MTDMKCPLGEDCDMTLAWMMGAERAKDTIKAQAAEIEKLRKDLSLSVFTDSEYCKVLERENERLLKSRNRWADKYNKLLVKHRAALEGK